MGSSARRMGLRTNVHGARFVCPRGGRMVTYRIWHVEASAEEHREMPAGKKRARTVAELGLPTLSADAVDALRTRLSALPPDGARAAVLLDSASASASSADELLALAFARLHTGHWASVDSAWRQCYMAAALMVAQARWSAGAAVILLFLKGRLASITPDVRDYLA